MSSLQKVIKYCAIAFAVLLAVGIISAIASAAVSIVSVVSGGFISDKDSKRVNHSESFSDVNSLEIDISTGTLIIKEGDTFRIEATNVTERFTTSLSGRGKLKINEKNNNVQFFWFSFNGVNNPSAKITLYLPANFVAEDIYINTGAGKVTIDGLHTKELFISSGVGSISGKNMTANRVKVDGGVGAITFRNASFQNADFNCGVGSVNFEGELLGDNTFDCGVGEVKLDLRGNVEDYELDIEAGIGTVLIDGKKISKSHTRNSKAEHSIEVDGGLGSVRIDFNK